MNKVTYPQPMLTGAEAGDIAITAAEGGIGYWAQANTYQPSRWSPSTGVNIDVDPDFVFYTIRDVVEHDGEEWKITPALIATGLAMVVAEGGPLAADIIDGDRDDLTARIDATAADVIIQYGVFGTLVYG